MQYLTVRPPVFRFYKDNKVVAEFILSLPFLFDKSLESLGLLVETLAGTDKIDLHMDVSQMTTYSNGNYLSSLGLMYEVVEA